jgi:hypothetical protein
MIDMMFGMEDKTIEVCSVDINLKNNPDLVEDGQTFASLPNNNFNRWRCDPSYNAKTAKNMYGTDLRHL